MRKTQSTIIAGAVGDLEIRINPPSDGHRWVVISHPHPQFGGTMDNKVVTTLEKAYQSIGFGSVVYQFRGVGLSAGEYDGGEGEQADLAAVVNWLTNEYTPSYLVLAGFSFGAYISLKQAATLEPDHLLVVAPPVNLYDFSAIQLPSVSWTLVQGSADEVVPALEVLDWALKLENMPDIHWRSGASHFFHRQLVWLKKIVLMAY
ncbi:alpha/beta hydrolase [Thiosulfativibrio zosterae]|uniref:Alpha/beta hydrolase n=1 Tax=Thiosulfativibrio zosterae TaxID=2675053 RepID=A0A6F8PLB0_9GAMM|nr:CocE/NonD family hydrolase [Thiosulfativibrio zosterae]BBP42875.1 alpha/beta hydrolase [Thiosulfativibrio zosterae]